MSDSIPLGSRFPYGCDRSGEPIIEDNRIADDFEGWLVSSYAIWAACFGGNLRFAGGYPRTKSNRQDFLEVLERDWEITNRDGLIDMITWISFQGEEESAPHDGWDLCRGNALAAMGYLAEMITRAEMCQLSILPSQILQKKLTSWEQVGASYLAGYEEWMKNRKNSAEDIKQRRASFKKVKQMPNGPWKRFPFQMELPKSKEVEALLSDMEY